MRGGTLDTLAYSETVDLQFLSFAVEDGERNILSEVCVIIVVLFPWPPYSAEYLRNKDKLRAYQREYARQKRAPGRQKVGKAERALLEEKHVQRRQLMAVEDRLPCSKAALDRCVCPLSPAIWFSQRYQGVMNVNLLYARKRRTPDALQT